MLTLAVDEGSVGLLLAVPVVVAVHGVVTAGDAGDLADAQRIELGLQVGEEALAGVRVGIAAIGDAVEVDLLGAHVLGHLQHAEPVVCVAVDTAGADQTHQVNGLARVDGGLHVLDQNRVLEHLTVLDGLGDEGELLVDDEAGTHVGVADLGVAHLAIGQANGHAGGVDGGHGVLCHQRIDEGLVGGGHSVTVGLVGGPAEAIHDAEHYGFLGHRYSPLY